MGKKKAKTNPKTAESLERRCWEDLAIGIILQALDDYTALNDDCVPVDAVIKVDGYVNDEDCRRYFCSDLTGVVFGSAKRFRQAEALLFLNSWWFKFLNPTEYTGNELIRMARRCKNTRTRHRYMEAFIQNEWRDEQ